MQDDNLKYISYDAFIERAAKDQSVNFVAFVITPWHAISLDASLRYLQSKGIKLNGMVLVFPHDVTGVNVTKDSFLQENYTIYVQDEAIHNGQERKISAEKYKFRFFLTRRKEHLCFVGYILFGGINWFRLPDMYLIKTVFPDPHIGLKMLDKGKFTQYVCMDEGVGTYTPFNDFKPKSIDVRLWFRYFREVVLGHQWISCFHRVTKTMILNNERNILYPRKEVIPYYRQVIEKHVYLSKNKYDLSNAIVIATSVYYEEREHYHGEDVRVWTKVCELLHTIGCEIYMKPHPRDTYFRQYANEWHCKLIDTSCQSMETLCAISQPKCIIGGPSTALVTANLLYDIPVICMYDLMNQDKCSNRIKSEVNYIKKMFMNFIQYPNNMHELEEMVKCAISK